MFASAERRYCCGAGVASIDGEVDRESHARGGGRPTEQNAARRGTPRGDGTEIRRRSRKDRDRASARQNGNTSDRRDGRIGRVPAPEFSRQEGSPDPLAALLAEETAALRQRRVTLSESQPSLADAYAYRMFQPLF